MRNSFCYRSNHIPLPAHTIAETDNKGISSSSMAELLTKIDTLSSHLESLELERRPPRFRRRGRSRSRSRESSTSGFCWYHATHGDMAYRCTKPCSFVSGNATRRTWARHVPPMDAHEIVHFLWEIACLTNRSRLTRDRHAQFGLFHWFPTNQKCRTYLCTLSICQLLTPMGRFHLLWTLVCAETSVGYL